LGARSSRRDQEGATPSRVVAGRPRLFLTGAGARTEHCEIAAYEGLVTMAEAMGETEVAELLTKDLEQERAALEKLQSPQGRLG